MALKIKQFKGGGVREDVPGKGLYKYMSMTALKRIALRYEYGADKYGASDNYKKGLPISDCWDSAFRHLIDYMDGLNNEDHLAAAAWNIIAMMELEVNNPQWMDIPARVGLPCKVYPRYKKEDSE